MPSEPSGRPRRSFSTPTARLVYHGAIDDNRDEADVTAHYLRDAIEAALAGDYPAVTETPPVGCTVKWRS